ncbi:MAG: PilZ domain-containing protein [Glaciecola sp.]|jgi:hypothetical protein
MSNELSEYRALINKLAPMLEQAAFKRLFEDVTKDLSNEKRFLIKMEIQRLAKPCLRVLDLRSKVPQPCEFVTYKGITHYLDAKSSKLFEEQTRAYGKYTFGVYEAVLALAEQQSHHTSVFNHLVSNEQVPPTDRNGTQYLAETEPLLDIAHRYEERMNFVVLVEVFLPDNQSFFATTVDISLHGLKLKLKEASQMHALQENTTLSVIFRGFSADSDLRKTAVEYQLVQITGQEEQARLHLERDHNRYPSLFDDYLRKLIKTNKRRYKVNLDNVVAAIENKIYEQAFSSTAPGLPVFIDTQDKGEPVAKFACVNGSNKEILDYWLDEDDEQNIGFLLNSSRLNTLFGSYPSASSLWVYAFTHIKDGKIYFYSATTNELDANPELKSVFLSYASRRVSWRVYRLSYDVVDPKMAHVPTSLPNGINKKIDRLNKKISPRLESKLQHITTMVTVSDVSHLVGQQCYQKIELERDKVKELAVFGHPRNKPPEPVLSFRYKQQELRKETRYKLRSSVELSTYSDTISGISEDCSVSGLKIELDLPYEQRINSRVSVSFPKLQKKTTQFVLEDLKYRVRHISYDKLVLHLEAISEHELSVAEQFFTALIENNKDKLKTISNEETVPGMGHALRCLHAKHSSEFCAFIGKQKGSYYPLRVIFENRNAAWAALLKHQRPSPKLNLSWLFQDKHKSNAFVRDALRTLRVDSRPTQAELYVAYDPRNHDIENAITAHWENELATHRSKLQFIKAARERGEFFAFSVFINKSARPDVSLLDQELSYLTRYAVHKAKLLEEYMWDISGQVFLSDITDEFLFRYQVHK